MVGLVVAMALPNGAFAFRAQNNLGVNPAGPATFEVIQRGGIDAADAWCAAGDYAIRVLRASGNQRVYLVEGRHIARTEDRRRYGYTFSLNRPPEAEALSGQPLTLSLRRVGDSLAASFAQQYCYNRLGVDEWDFN